MIKIFHRVFVMILFIAFTSICQAQVPVVNSATPNNTTVGKYEKFELDINLTAAYANPYDYDEISVKCTITKPGGGQDVVDGFYMQNFTIGANGFANATGTSSFKIRYSPVLPGTYSYVVAATTALGTGSLPAQTFECVSSALPGFIRKSATNYLKFDNGKQYIPIGENMGWQLNSVTSNYSNWLSSLADNGGNFIRVWMSSWAFALEWKNGSNGYEGLKKYKQSNAFYLDWLLDYCKQKSVYVMLALNNHGQVSTNVNPEWNNNPYNLVNGGPAANTWDFFTSPVAKNLHKNRLRYIVARYGYSQQIQSWELFNELHWTNDFENKKNDLTAWDDEMSTYLKEKDVNKHLVTTSYGGTETITNTWSLSNIDFTQTHFYVNSPNIESVLAPANQTFLSQYAKPTLNGEFGLGPSGATLSADDPNGVHIHNAIWGSMFSGGLGSGMTWWWDDYVEPRNLYYHYKPLAGMVSLVNFVDDNYKKVSPVISGGGTSDMSVSPGGGFAQAAASSFTVDASGGITPGASSMSQYIFGSTYNTQYRNPPTFTVTYPVAGQFKVVTASVSASSPKVTIYLDNILLLNENALASTTYSINVPQGQHTIKVDNLGVDWTQVSNFVFTNIGSPLSAYVLKASANNKVAGYILNNKYNWQYLKSNGNVPPPPVAGASINIPGMANGNYTVLFYSTATGDQLSTLPVTVSNGSLQFALPSIGWDVAFRAAENSTLPIKLSSFKGERKGTANMLYIDIASSENVKAVYLERGTHPSGFKMLSALNLQWNGIAGNHTYTDLAPLQGANYYRLRIVDVDGRETFSGIVKLSDKTVKFSVQPNPFTNHVSIQLQSGNYLVSIVDQQGKNIYRRTMESLGSQSASIDLANVSRGVYYVTVINNEGKLVGTQKIVK